MKTARAPHPFHSVPFSLKRRFAPQNAARTIWTTAHARAHPDGNPDKRARDDGGGGGGGHGQTPAVATTSAEAGISGGWTETDGRTSLSHGTDLVESGRVEQFHN